MEQSRLSEGMIPREIVDLSEQFELELFERKEESVDEMIKRIILYAISFSLERNRERMRNQCSRFQSSSCEKYYIPG